MREGAGKKNDEKRSGRARAKKEPNGCNAVQCSRTKYGQTPDASSITSYSTVPLCTVLHCPCLDLVSREHKHFVDGEDNQIRVTEGVLGGRGAMNKMRMRMQRQEGVWE